MQMNIHDAKTNLSKLVEAAEAGEEVIIARNNKPAVRLVPIGQMQSKSGFRFGTMAHLLTGPIPDFLEPMTEEELRLWEGADDDIGS
jgi:prevent-host-death family protein